MDLELERTDQSKTDLDENVVPDWKGLWDVEEADRFLKLCRRNPELLNYEEQVRWRLVKECGYFWKGRYGPDYEWSWKPQEDEPDRFHLRQHWGTVCEVASGKLSEPSMPRWSPFLPEWARKPEDVKLFKNTALPLDLEDLDLVKVPGGHWSSAKTPTKTARKGKQ